MKVLLRFLLMVVLVSYLFVSFFFLRSYAAEDKCRDLQVEITDSAVLHYISPADVYNYIEDFEMDPCGKPLGGIDTGTGTEQASADRRSGMLQNTQRQSMRGSDTAYSGHAGDG